MYAAGRTKGIEVISVTDPEEPVFVNEDALHSKYQLRSLEIDNGFTYIHTVSRGFLIADVIDVDNPEVLWEYVKPYNSNNLLFLKKYLHYIYYGGGVGARNALRGIILDVQDPAQPDSVGAFGFYGGFGGRPPQMQIVDHYGFIAGRHYPEQRNFLALTLEDPTDPDTIVIRQDCQEPLPISYLDGSLLYQIGLLNDWGDATPRVFVYSLEDPGEPEFLGSWPVGPENQYVGFGMQILARNSYAYVWCDGVHEIWIYNVEDPVEPEFVRSVELSISYVTDMSIDGNIIYLGGSKAGFGCLSINNPENPEIVGYYDTPGGVYDIESSEGYVYVADDYELGIYDCAELHGIWDLQISEDSHNFEYVSPGSTAIWELTLTNAAEQAVDILSVTIDSAAFNVEFDDAITLEPDEEASVPVTFAPRETRAYFGALTIHTERRDVVIELLGTGEPQSAPEESTLANEFELYSAFPNPFNSQTVISYSLPRRAMVDLRVFDLSGRTVANLSEGFKSRGLHRIAWEVSDLPSGIYLLRLHGSGQSRLAKITLIR